MEKWIKVSEHITVGPQPTEEELEHFLKEGFQGVVNLREPGEPAQVLSPEAEGVKVEGLGMEYLHVPVSVTSLTHDRVDDFCSQLTALPRPILVHCGTGMRAGALCMMALGVEERMSSEEVLNKARAMGFECKSEDLKAFVKDYLDKRNL
ncbi:MAG: protein tyrosine phosphatase family protein [Gammaproteobacteria bacterium]|nr:protein tyrosine phosphatase family protein [Gammaproteobacteria bacterium]